jgi:hypothetical protein
MGGVLPPIDANYVFYNYKGKKLVIAARQLVRNTPALVLEEFGFHAVTVSFSTI